MFIYSATKRNVLRAVMIVLAVLASVGVLIFTVISAIDTEAASTKIPIYCVDRGDNKISLTFDCAWGNSNTDELLKILSDENVSATFFATGEFCDKYPGDVLKFFKAGHEIQNHSDCHPHVNEININSLIDDTRSCANKIEKITGCTPTLYRAPYGEYNDNVMSTIEGMEYKVIQWSVDSIDWQEPSASEIIKRVTEKTESGSILLFHNDLENTTNALPEVIKHLKKCGYEFVPVSELIYTDSYHIDNAGKQIYDVKVSETAFIAYTSNSVVNNALNSVRDRLSAEQLVSLPKMNRTELTATLLPLLSAEQLSELSKLTDTEILSALAELSEAVILESEEYPIIGDDEEDLEDEEFVEIETDDEEDPKTDKTENKS